METIAIRQVMRLELSQELFQRYEIQANAAGKTVEDYLSDRLEKTIDYNSVHGIYLQDGDRLEMMNFLKRNFSTASQLMEIMRNAVTLKLEGAQAILDQTLLKRAQARADVERVSLEDWLVREAIAGLERTCGMR